MSEQTLTEQVQELGLALQGIERELSSGEVPRNVLEDFRAAVDHARMTLWAVMTTARHEQQSVVAATISRARLSRTIQMLRQTLQDIEAGAVTPATPEFSAYHQALRAALERLNEIP